MIDYKWTILVIAICALITLFERSFPFIIFRNREVPSYISYLGKVLGLAIMTTLFFYCIRGISFSSSALYAPQIISSLITVILHLWKRNTLVSILGGTVSSMVLTQFVFTAL